MNKSPRHRTLYLTTALLTTLVLGLSCLAWSQGVRGDVGRYEFFPLLGLMAFGLMWMHYVSGSLKRYVGLANDTSVLRRYFTVTSVIVLGLILLHPGLLYTGLYADGFGLPPVSSFAVYESTGARIALLLGSISLTIFLLFELKRWFGERKWWKYIDYINMAAMIMIFTHALIIGSDLMNGWFRFVWIAIGWILVLSLVYNYWYDHQRRTHGTK